MVCGYGWSEGESDWGKKLVNATGLEPARPCCLVMSQGGCSSRFPAPSIGLPLRYRSPARSKLEPAPRVAS